ncbi:MAG: efflux RND transporter periplasmic adaptor subunit [Bacillota bacterium]|nr:efflux RND transporter periplasmic adaptor subunit [Bacillota bacterium]
MKRKIIEILIACIVIAGVGVGGYYGYQHFKGTKTTSTAPAYITMTATRRNLEVNIQGTGTVFAGTSKDITAPNSGTISGLAVKIGDKVTKDSTLFTVNNDQLQQSIDQAQNDVTRQQIGVNTAQNQLDKADTDEKKASAGYQLSIAKLSLQDAKDKLESNIEAKNNATVKAPFDGLVVAQSLNNGDTVQSGKSILTVIDPASLKVKVSVDELDIQKVQVGQKAKITLGALTGKIFDGAVEYISPTGTSTNNITTYDVVIGIQNPENIRLGMNANITLSVASKENVLVIPVEAMIDSNGRKFVMVPSDGQTTAQTQLSGTQNSGQGQGNTSNQGNGQNSSGNTNRNGNTNNSGNGQNRRNTSGYGSAGGFGNGTQNGTARSNQTTSATPSINGRLVPIQTGLEGSDYIEVVSGITEGQKLIVELPQVNSTNNNNNNNRNLYNMMGNQGGGFQRNSGGGQRPAGN